MKVKDMLLKESIQERREKNAREIQHSEADTRFGAGPADTLRGLRSAVWEKGRACLLTFSGTMVKYI